MTKNRVLREVTPFLKVAHILYAGGQIRVRQAMLILEADCKTYTVHVHLLWIRIQSVRVC